MRTPFNPILAAAACLASTADASVPVRITQTLPAGQPISQLAPGSLQPAWTVASFRQIHINNSGHWYAEVLGPTGAGQRGAALINLTGSGASTGTSILSEHWATDQLANVPGLGPAAHRAFNNAALANTGAVARLVRLTSGTTIGDTYNNTVGFLPALYLNTSHTLTGSGTFNYTGPAPIPDPPGAGALYAVQGDLIGPPAAGGTPGLGANSRWGRPNFARWGDDTVVLLNDQHQALLLAQYVDPTRPPGAITHALARLDLSPSGQLLATNMIAKTSDSIPGFPGQTISAICLPVPPPASPAGASHKLAFNNAGQAAYTVLSSTGASHLIVGSTVVASSGTLPHASTGLTSNYAALLAAPCDLNDSGDCVFRAVLEDGTAAIIKRTAAGIFSTIARTGAAAPEVPGATLTAVGHTDGPVKIDATGRVVWYGRFNSPTSNAALFRDDQILIRQGATYRIDGSLIGPSAALASPGPADHGLDFDADGFDLSDDGHWLIFKLNGPDSSSLQAINIAELCPEGTNTCSTQPGACCIPGVGCSSLTELDCAAAGGTLIAPFAPCTTCAPINDLCENAIDLNAVTLPYQVVITNTSATDDPDLACNHPASGAATRFGVWFRFTAPADGTLIPAETGTQDVVVGAFVGSCAALSPAPGVACQTNDNPSGFLMTAGQSAWILVGKDGAAATTPPAPASPLVLTFSFAAAPANDECAAAADWGSQTGELPFVNTGAATSASNQSVACPSPQPMHNDVWHTWTAPAAGTVSLLPLSATVSPPFQSRIAVYALEPGAMCPASTAVPTTCTSGTNFTTLPVTAGQAFAVQLASTQFGAAGSGALELLHRPILGACCIPAGCTMTTPTTCAALSGEYRGEGMLCFAPAAAPAIYTAPIPAAGETIPDNNAAGWSSHIDVPDAFLLANVTLSLKLTHTWTGDLTATLIHEPAAGGGGEERSIDLLRRPLRGLNNSALGSSDDLIANAASAPYVFSDAPMTSFWQAVAADGPSVAPGTYKPSSSADLSFSLLESFCAQSAAGRWTLRISDNAPADLGTVFAWSLSLTSIAPTGAACGSPTGACCIGTGCSFLPQAECLAAQGAYRGDGSVCQSQITCCPVNFNHTGGITAQDIFDFLAAWFANTPAADFNGLNGVTAQDVFDFLAAWFTGCS